MSRADELASRAYKGGQAAMLLREILDAYERDQSGGVVRDNIVARLREARPLINLALAAIRDMAQTAARREAARKACAAAKGGEKRK